MVKQFGMRIDEKHPTTQPTFFRHFLLKNIILVKTRFGDFQRLSYSVKPSNIEKNGFNSSFINHKINLHSVFLRSLNMSDCRSVVSFPSNPMRLPWKKNKLSRVKNVMLITS